MKTNETNTISYKVKSNFKQLLFIEIIKLIEYMTKVFIACSIFFLFLSVFTYNLQIQTHDYNKKDSLLQCVEIVQVNTFKDTIESYLYDR